MFWLYTWRTFCICSHTFSPHVVKFTSQASPRGRHLRQPSSSIRKYFVSLRASAARLTLIVVSANMHDEHSSVSTLRRKFMRIVYDWV